MQQYTDKMYMYIKKIIVSNECQHTSLDVIIYLTQSMSTWAVTTTKKVCYHCHTISR